MAIPLKKKLSLIATITIIIITAAIGYYLLALKKGPYSVSDFESFTYKWGTGDSLINSYASVSGDYQYLNQRDSLIKTKVKLKANDIIFIHNRINELGFWEMPDQIGKKSNNAKASKYELQFNYKKNSKKLIIYSDYKDRPLLLDSAMRIKNLLEQVLDAAEERYQHSY